MIVHPTLHISAAAVTLRISITSGAIQYGVPSASSPSLSPSARVPSPVPRASLASPSLPSDIPSAPNTPLNPSPDPRPPFVATPKSANFTTPSFVVNIFAPLMSLCTTPCECRYASPRNTCATYTAHRLSGNAPNRLGCTVRASDPFSAYSSMMYKHSSTRTAPSYFTIFACSSLDSSSTSLVMRSSCSTGTPRRGISFTAQIDPVRWSTALCTRDVAPEPMSSPRM